MLSIVSRRRARSLSLPMRLLMPTCSSVGRYTTYRPGQRDVARAARALRADRLLGDLDDDVLALLDDVADRRRLREPARRARRSAGGDRRDVRARRRPRRPRRAATAPLRPCVRPRFRPRPRPRPHFSPPRPLSRRSSSLGAGARGIGAPGSLTVKPGRFGLSSRSSRSSAAGAGGGSLSGSSRPRGGRELRDRRGFASSAAGCVVASRRLPRRRSPRSAVGQLARRHASRRSPARRPARTSPSAAASSTSATASAAASSTALGDGFRRRFFDLDDRGFRDAGAAVVGRRPLGTVAGSERVLASARQVRLEVVGPDQILDVEERGALEPDVDEGGLQPRQDPGDLA